MIRRLILKVNAGIWRVIGPMSVKLFHKYIYFHKRDSTWMNTFWMGTLVEKIPFDLWVQQEIIFETKPDLLIETGTFSGGSAMFYASLFDLMGHGEIVSVDLDPQPNLPTHPRVTYLLGSSVDPDIVANLRERAAGKKVMMILDSDHSEAHVRKELDILAGLVTPGMYLVVEDTNVYGHPVLKEHGPGPMEALDDWLKTKPPFDNDASREKYMVCFHPRGYWKRRS